MGVEDDWLAANPPQQSPAERRVRRWMWGCGIGCAVLAGLLFASIVALGLLSQSGTLPQTRAVPGDEVAEKFRDYLAEQGLLEDGERILYFYSEGLVHVGEGCSYFTDRRVVSFSDGSRFELARRDIATYPEIEAIRVEFEDDWMADSSIEVEMKSGSVLTLLVCNDEGGDREFERLLRNEWHRRREPPEKR